MKFIIVLACLSIFVASTQAQISTTTSEDGLVEPNPVGITTPRPGPVTAGPARSCKGHVLNPSCIGRKSEGFGRSHACMANANHKMWHFSRLNRECQPMMYKGCGGNSNRHCTKASCNMVCNGRGAN